MQYKIVSSSSLYELTRMVNGFLRVGWEPQGGVNAGWREFYKDFLFTQALIKRYDDET